MCFRFTLIVHAKTLVFDSAFGVSLFPRSREPSALGQMFPTAFVFSRSREPSALGQMFPTASLFSRSNEALDSWVPHGLLLFRLV